MSRHPETGLTFSRRFLPLFGLFQFGTFNDNALKNALIALIVFMNVAFLETLSFGNWVWTVPEDMKVPIAALIFTGPFTVLCAIAGQIADKVDRGTIFRWVKRAEVGIMLIAALGFYLEDLRILGVSLALMGAQSAFFSPTKNAVLPQWLTEQELIRGNALMSGFQFATLLAATIFGLFAPQIGTTPIVIVLLTFAILGWLSAETCLPAPPPMPDLKVNFEPLTATISVLKRAFAVPDVLRPLLGISWFYGLSTVFVTTLPNFVKTTMGFDQSALQILLASSTVSILIGSMFVLALGNMRVWGPEAVRLSALGIIGVSLFTLGFILVSPPNFVGPELGNVGDFLSDPNMPLFLGMLCGASVSSGVFVVPLQAMAQRRSAPDSRARLMSAGSVLLNLFVNITTFGLVGLGALTLGPYVPFWLIVIGSTGVAGYAVFRSIKPIKRPLPGVT